MYNKEIVLLSTNYNLQYNTIYMYASTVYTMDHYWIEFVKMLFRSESVLWKSSLHEVGSIGTG